MHSIRLNLLKWLIVPLTLINLLAGALMFNLAWGPSQLAFDKNLINEAWGLIPRLRTGDSEVEIELSHQAEEMLRIDRFDDIYFVIRDDSGKTIAGDDDFPRLQIAGKLDIPYTYDQTMRGDPIRVASLKTMIGSQPIYIGVGETLRKRHQVRSEIILDLFLVEMLLNSLLISSVWYAVSKGLKPLDTVRDALNARHYDDLSNLQVDDVSAELRPVVNAIDDLLSRAQTGARAKQDFLANVAHQLRTPLAGLKMQLEWVRQRHADETETMQSCDMMLSSLDRMVRQTNQLLALARAEPSQFEKNTLESIELDKLVAESVQHFVQQAHKKSIDLGFELHPTKVAGDRFLLRDLIDNLIDNAIRYSPPGAMVTVSCHENGPQKTLTVEDNGPGIPPQDREKIFNRFYRLDDNTAGSGLGLAIVRDIVRDHDATITIGAGSGGKGTVFSVAFP